MISDLRWTRRDIPLGPLLARYRHNPETGRVDLVLLPASVEGKAVERRVWLEGVELDAYTAATQTPIKAEKLDSLVQLKEITDDYPPAFAQGSTLRNSGTIERLRLTGFQLEQRGKGGITIRSTLTHDAGWRVRHELSWESGQSWLVTKTCVENTSSQPINLEMLASFSLAGITPFATDDAPGRLVLHRFRSVWSMEGRLESRPIEELQLERSWAGWGVRGERFGSVGSMPVRNFFPVVAIEDTVAGVTWAARLACPGSWQMEVYRRDDGLALSGGLADREFGHWTKNLAPGESMESPLAFLTCVEGGIDDACEALLDAINHSADQHPRREQGLPLIVNEWATSWGRPTHAAMCALVAQLRGLDARYLVIDAGWYGRAQVEWGNAHGDWEPSLELYPHGLKATADAIRAEGLIPGLWFELETCGKDSWLFANRPDLMLHRDGRPITVGARRFLDFRNSEVIDYLARRVIGLLRECGFGYLKVDYNDTIGIGADGAESLGEALRQHLLGVQAFFRRVRDELPDLVIENCSSGGHRLEPSFFALSEMSSFSDAHESPEIPVIAANLHRLVPITQSQIWVVLRSNENRQRTIYSLAAGFLGRFCLSGDLLGLSPEQRELLQRALVFYRDCESILLSGTSRRQGPDVSSYRHAEGWQAVVRKRTDAAQLLVVAHRFGGDTAKTIDVVLPPGNWRLTGVLDTVAATPIITARILQIMLSGPWEAQVVRLELRPRKQGHSTVTSQTSNRSTNE